MSQAACFGKGYFFSRARLRLLKRDIVSPIAEIVQNFPCTGMRPETS
jgi:hypothetical protein